MARKSDTDNVRKICGCAKWKECAHPWFIFYREGKEIGPTGKVRERGLRQKLAPLVGREPVDYADAKAEARRAIVAWKDGRDARQLLPDDAPSLAAVLEAYGQRPGGAAIDKYQRKQIVKTVVTGRPFGEWRAAEITREMVEAFRRQRPTVAGNRDLALLRAMFNWAVLSELVPSTPFKIGTVSAVKLAREEARTRRLEPGEEDRLLEAAHGLLRDLVVAALETGCRMGELLSLQWHQVRGDLFFPAGKTKAKKPRRVPVSTVLRGVLDARRLDPAGEPLPPSAYVFGDDVGRRRRSIRGAWVFACQRAAITGLHFHDLRREAGSRWMDLGVPLATIQRWLGHANISQTSTYLAASGGGDADAMRAFEQAAGRLPNVAVLPGSNDNQPTSTGSLLSEKTEENVIVH
jgi:integrase